MTQEEKLEEAKRLYETANADQRYVLERLFPELIDGDERIRKALITIFKHKNQSFIDELTNYSGDIKIEEVLSWLEKQEKNSTWSEEDEKIKKEITGILRNAYWTSNRNRFNELVAWLDKKGEQNSAWSEVDEYTLGETIQHLEELIRIDKAKHFGDDVQYYQRDIDWLKSLKDRIQPQPKQEWSEEDEKIGKELIDFCIKCSQGHTVVNSQNDFTRWTTWLKSLRPQPHWRPSSEQLAELRNIFAGCSYELPVLESLYNDLIKL